MDPFDKPFSWGLVFGSIAFFMVIEIMIGSFVGPFVLNKFLSDTLTFSLRGFINLGSFFLGGLIIGAVSPVRRPYEPAAAVFLYIFLMFCLTFFHPRSYYVFNIVKALIGGGIAFALAFIGTRMGINLMRRDTF